MKTMIAFTKKEFMEQARSKKLLVLGIVFVILGIMNPLVAKLTPWLYDQMSEQLKESGLSVGTITVDAMTSWEQFFKNISSGLIAFVLLESSIFTKEYQSGTLIMSLTKGLKRYKVVLAKTFVLLSVWTAYFWMCFLITYAYNDFYWDNGIASHTFVAGLLWWLFGVWVISIMVIFSTFAKSGGGVLLGTGGVVFGIYILSMIPKVSKYLETMLTNGYSIMNGTDELSKYLAATIITVVVTDIFFWASIIIFNKKQV